MAPFFLFESGEREQDSNDENAARAKIKFISIGEFRAGLFTQSIRGIFQSCSILSTRPRYVELRQTSSYEEEVSKKKGKGVDLRRSKQASQICK